MRTLGLLKLLKKGGVKAAQAGAATVEFVIVFPVFMIAFYWLFDTGWIAFQVVQLDRGVELTTRELMVSDVTETMTDSEAHEYLKGRVCDQTIIRDCRENLILEIRQFDDFTTRSAANLACVNRTDEIEPKYTADAGNCTSEDEIVIFRACLLVDLLMPPALSMYDGTATSDGALEVRSTSAFVNEPC